jgi:hypothetical protein
MERHAGAQAEGAMCNPREPASPCQVLPLFLTTTSRCESFIKSHSPTVLVSCIQAGLLTLAALADSMGACSNGTL